MKFMYKVIVYKEEIYKVSIHCCIPPFRLGFALWTTRWKFSVEKPEGVYISVFRLNSRRWHECWSKRTLEGEKTSYHVASLSGHMVGPHF
jgi:hypothetical protein